MLQIYCWGILIWHTLYLWLNVGDDHDLLVDWRDAKVIIGGSQHSFLMYVMGHMT